MLHDAADTAMAVSGCGQPVQQNLSRQLLCRAVLFQDEKVSGFYLFCCNQLGYCFICDKSSLLNVSLFFGRRRRRQRLHHFFNGLHTAQHPVPVFPACDLNALKGIQDCPKFHYGVHFYSFPSTTRTAPVSGTIAIIFVYWAAYCPSHHICTVSAGFANTVAIVARDSPRIRMFICPAWGNGLK